MTNLTTLKATLEIDPRYDGAVRSGKNSQILALLNENEAGQIQFLVVPTDDVLEAIGDGVRGLTAAQIETLCLFTARDTVDFRKEAIRDEIQEVFSGKAAVQTRLQAVGQRTRTYGEAFTDGGLVSLRDLWAVLKDIPKSYMAQYLVRP